MRYRITTYHDGRAKHHDYDTFAEAEAVASDIFTRTGVVVGIVAV